MKPDYYELLGVTPEASIAEIKDAYRRAARTAHPDAGGTPGLFRLITEAYETLRDPSERAAYDARLNGRGVATDTDVEEDVTVAGVSVDADWGTETTWDADADPDVKDFPRTRLLRWAASSDHAHRARTASWIIGPVLFIICLSALVMPDLIRPDAASADAFSWLLQAPPITLVVAAVYVFLARPMIIGVLEGMLVPHAVVAIGFVAWPVAYWDIATSGERWIYGGFFVAFLLYLVTLSIICVVNEADLKAERRLI